MSNLAQINDLGLRRALGFVNLTKSVLAINAGGAATIKTTNANTVMLDGVLLSLAALAAQSFAVTHNLLGQPVSGASASGPAAYVQPANTTVIYLVCRNAGGVAIVQGGWNGQNIVLPGGIVRQSKGEIPEVPVGFVVIGAVKVALGNVTFTPGTTVLDMANVTATYTDLGLIPASTAL